MIKIKESPLLEQLAKVKVQPTLLSQAVRVYLANQRQGSQSALTRAQVDRTGKKLYKQKGTGGARHGSRRAPIFVGGGVTFAPKPRDYGLSLSSKMRSLARLQALAQVAKQEKVRLVSGLEEVTGKTKEMADFLKGAGTKGKTLLIIDKLDLKMHRSARNIPGLEVSPLNQINAYAILQANTVFLTESALGIILKVPQKSEPKEEPVKRVRKTAKKT